MKKVLTGAAVFVFVVFVLQSTLIQSIYYKGKINRVESVEVELGAELDAVLSEEQMTVIQDLFLNATWTRSKYDLATTDHLLFDDLLVDILSVSDGELIIGIGRNQYLLTDVELDNYEVIFD